MSEPIAPDDTAALAVDEEALKDAVSAYAHMICASEFGGFLLVEPEWMRAAITAYLVAIGADCVVVRRDDLRTVLDAWGNDWMPQEVYDRLLAKLA